MQLLIRPTDYNDDLEYRNLEGIWKNLKDVELHSKESIQKWITNLSKSSRRYSLLLKDGHDRITKQKLLEENPAKKYEVVNYWGDDYNDKFVGLIRVDDIDHANRNCVVGLDIVEEFQGCGLAKAGYHWLLDYLFLHYNMNMLYADVIDDNVKSASCIKSMGFQECGRWPQKIFRDGKYKDYVMFYLDRENYEKISK